MGKSDSLGQFEQLVLAAVKSIENAYGVPIHAMVEQVYGKPVKFASIYTTLDRLEEKAYITSRDADRTALRGNLPKRYYTIAPRGEKALQDSAKTAGRFLELLGVNHGNPEPRPQKAEGTVNVQLHICATWMRHSP